MFQNANLTEESVVRILVYEIRERNPNAVQFVPDTNAIKMIACYMKEGSVNKLIYSYGLEFVNELLKLCEEVERYEMCILIRNAIFEYNKLTDK